MKKAVFFGFLVLLCASCTGPIGPEGPTGPEGPVIPGLYYVKLFQQGIYPTISYSGQVQSSLRNLQSNAYYTNNSNPIDLGHYVGTGEKFRAMIRFDLSSLPSTKVMVDKAELILKTNTTGISGGAGDVTAHKVTNLWAVFEASWYYASSILSWTDLGGDFTSNTITTNAANYDFSVSSTITIPLDPAVVQEWMMSPSTNYGILFKASNETIDNACQIYSSGDIEPENRPLLKVWYYTTE